MFLFPNLVMLILEIESYSFRYESVLINRKAGLPCVFRSLTIWRVAGQMQYLFGQTQERSMLAANMKLENRIEAVVGEIYD